MLGDHPEAVEASLIAEYGRDYLGDYLAGLHAQTCADCGEEIPAGERVSLRQLRVLLDGLPPTSALGRAMSGNAWTDETHLLAVIADLLQVSNTQVAAAAGAKGVKKPKPMPRPENADGEEHDPNAEAREAHRRLVAQVMPGR